PGRAAAHDDTYGTSIRPAPDGRYRRAGGVPSPPSGRHSAAS
ncbi:hypothetical protein GA0115239_106024, partial [Streptomyces sp. BpilaLS-43]